MNATIRLSALSLASLLGLGGAAAAQISITTLVEQGDTIPGVGEVTQILSSAVNNSGEWLVEVDTDYSNFGQDSLVLRNGDVYMREGVVNSGFDSPVGGWYYDVKQLELNDHGEVLALLRGSRSDGSSMSILVVDGRTIVESDATPAPADLPATFTTWSDLQAAWLNNSGQLLVSGSVEDGAGTTSARLLVRYELDDAGEVAGATTLAYESQQFPGHDALVKLVGNGLTNCAINDAGNVLFLLADEDTTIAGNPNGCCDTYYYLDATQLLREGSPTGFDTETWRSMYGTSVDLAANGQWAGSFSSDTSSGVSGLLVKNGDTVMIRSGDVVPGVAGEPTITQLSGRVSISDSGQVFWQCTWPGPGSGLFRDDDILLQSGLTTHEGDLIVQILGNLDERSVSSNGSYVTQEMRIARAGGDKSGCYLLSLSPVASTFCFGDTSEGDCPCWNHSSPEAGEGCVNSRGYGALLTAVGTSKVADDDAVFQVTQAVPNQPSVLVQGAVRIAPAPFKDGMFCLGNPTRRVETVVLDRSGAGETQGSIATQGKVVPGESRYYQMWYRDPNGFSPCGSGSNFTNGVRVDWQ